MVDFQNGVFIKLKRIDPEKIMGDIGPLLVMGESVVSAYKGIRDYVVFTDKRVISVNAQGITGKKRDYTSMPYSKISVFSVETAGVFEMTKTTAVFLYTFYLFQTGADSGESEDYL